MIRFLSATFLLASLTSSAAQQAADLSEAKERCSKGLADTILVYAHGSDWNPAGERLLKSLWQDPALAKGLPDSVVMVAVDLPETGFRPRFRQLLSRLPAPSGAAVTAVSGKNGSSYTRQSDGSWLADPKSNPHHEVLSLTFKTGASPCSALRLQTLSDPSFAREHSGRAGGNGNFAINEVELFAGSAKLAIRNALADAVEKDPNNPREASNLIDGSFEPSRMWSVHGTDLKSQNLLLELPQDLAPNSDYTLKIHCLSPWGQHVPGRLRLEAVESRLLTPEFTAVFQQAELENRNRVLQIANNNLPAIFAYSPDGERFGALVPLRPEDRAGSIINRLGPLMQKRRDFDKLYAEAKGAAPLELPEKMVKAAEVLGDELGQTRRKEILAAIHKVDPNRQNPWSWRFDFNLDSVRKEKDERLKAKGEQAALDYLDSVLSSLRAGRLKPEQKQQLVLEKFLIARNWKGQEIQKNRILEQMEALAPTSHYGIGARGQIDYYGHGIPTLAYGWWPRHVQPGANTLNIQKGLAVLLPVSGSYDLTLATRGGSKNPCVIESAAFVDAAGKELSTAVSGVTIGPGHDNEVKLRLQLPKGSDPEKLSLRLKFKLDSGTEHSCTLILRPALPEDGPFGWEK
ncbi:MAG: hypothetical protein RL095_796 [Verrucomicrobiota bacterium]|jgi:hypothetical protein